jgi:pSer/pThr/pTyr-binding forkhead associated (FHA) protein
MAFLQVYYNGELKFKLPLKPDTTRIGRSADNDVVIDNSGVSAHHAFIVRDGDDFYIEDNNSTNGVFVNGLRVSRRQLRFGDEITVFKHKLKFTAVDISLPSSGAAPALANQAISEQNRTVQVDIGQIQAIMRERQAQSAYLLQSGDGEKQNRKFILAKPRFDIGKAENCDIRTGGWFAPKLAAKIMRQSNGYYLFPEKGGKVRVNGIAVASPVKLQNHDHLEVRGIALSFYESAAKSPAPD